LKRTTWTESDVLALPPGQEHDSFDRKSGLLIAKAEFRDDLARHLSAFANSGGGHLILGMHDNGTFDGVSRVRAGKTTTREWLEQIVPELLSYPLQNFRVHEVLPSTPSDIPDGQVVIVIDVGDSALAPHQSARSKIYYHRSGGHSNPAPHFYLEALRNRLVAPSLEPQLADVTLFGSYKTESGPFLTFTLVFRVLNAGRVAAYRWALAIDAFGGNGEGRQADYGFDRTRFPRPIARQSSVRMDDTILPSQFLLDVKDFGVQLRPRSDSIDDIEAELRSVLPEDFRLICRAISEVSPGVPTPISLQGLIDYHELAIRVARNP
jgi:hypothetical protein